VNVETFIVGPIEVNCYIVTCKKTNKAAVIDPGDNAADILKVVRSRSLDIEYILLTHGHFDHLGGVARIKKATNATVLMNKDDQYMVETAAQQAKLFGLPVPGEFDVDRFVDESDIIEIGNLKASILTTPGHSKGSVCYLFDKSVFVGDTLFYGGVGRTDLEGGSFEQLVHSIKSKLFTLSDDVKVYCGHGPSTTIGREKKYNPFIN
jgi:hydroxyacylglutathione hydrolase